jgi:hypothetical protein
MAMLTTAGVKRECKIRWNQKIIKFWGKNQEHGISAIVPSLIITM